MSLINPSFKHSRSPIDKKSHQISNTSHSSNSLAGCATPRKPISIDAQIRTRIVTTRAEAMKILIPQQQQATREYHLWLQRATETGSRRTRHRRTSQPRRTAQTISLMLNPMKCDQSAKTYETPSVQASRRSSNQRD